MAEIHEPVPLDDISGKNLLRIRHFSSSVAFANWGQYADDECNIAIDRYRQFPFFLTVWIHKQNEQARLMFFSDHYMSDGYSGMIVLNCILEQVTLLSNQRDFETREISSGVLLYTIMLFPIYGYPKTSPENRHHPLRKGDLPPIRAEIQACTTDPK